MGRQVEDMWAETDEYAQRAIERIMRTFPYTEKDLLHKSEVDFFRILKRVEIESKDKAARARAQADKNR